MSAHTPGPWFYAMDAKDPNWPFARNVIYSGDEMRPNGIASIFKSGPNPRQGDVDGRRIVACVNACEGIADPAALRTERDELLAALRALASYTGGSDSPPGHPCRWAANLLDRIGEEA